VGHRLAIGWVVFAVLVIGVSPAHFWLDAGEIAAAGADLGVMHPTGVPGYTHLLRAAACLPVGTIGFRMGLVSAGFGTAAILTLVRLLERRDAHPLTWWGAALWALAGLTFVRHGRVVEIYTFGAWLAVVALWGFDPAVSQSRRNASRLIGLGAAVWASWCFGDLRLALGPAAVVTWVVALRRGEGWARWAPSIVVLVSMVVLTVPLSSAREPVTDWGDPDTLGRLWDHLQARSIRVAFADEILPRSFDAWRRAASGAVLRLGQDIGPLGIPLAVVGLVRWSGHEADRPLVAWVTWAMAVEVFYAVGINPMGGADRQTGLVLGLLAILAVAAPLGRLCSDAEDRPRATLRYVVSPLVWTMGILPAAWFSVRDVPVTRSWMPHAWSRAALDQVPPGALVLTQSDDLSAGLLAAQRIEGARPDLVCVVAQHLHKPAPEQTSTRTKLVWNASATASGEGERIVAVLRAWPHAAALEGPVTDVFADTPWWSPFGTPPLAVAGPGAEGVAAETFDADAFVSTWTEQSRSVEDLARVARALGARARAELIVGGGRPESLARAEELLLRILDDVDAGHVPTLVALGSVHDRLGRTQSAITLTRRALALEPDRAVAHRNLALYLTRSGEVADLELALDHARRAHRLEPHDPRHAARLNEICRALGHTDCE